MKKRVVNLSPAARFRVVVLAGCLCIVLGIFVVYQGFKELWLAGQSSSWPTTAGVVEHSSVSTNRSQKNMTYSPNVRYRYEVLGMEYSGSRIGFGDFSSNFAAPSQEIADRYPTGTEVVVHYRPESPDVSVLESGVSTRGLGMPRAGIIVTLVGVGMIVLVVKFRSKLK